MSSSAPARGVNDSSNAPVVGRLVIRWLFGAEGRREDGPPWSVMESEARSVNGACT